METVSVITVVKDHACGLVETYESLLGQTFTDWEMIIVVGISKDDTLSVAQKIQVKDSRIQIVEQEGPGIYPAMNVGLDLAIGEFTWFMNAGDKFATSVALTHAVDQISRDGVGMLVGGYQIDKGSADQVYRYPAGDLTTLGFAFNRRGGCHQAMIFRTLTLKKIGGFNSSYSLAGDFELVLKVIKKAGARRTSEVYATIEPGGRADQGIFLVHQQKHQIRRSLLGGPFILFASLLWTGLARVKINTRGVFKK